MASIDKADWHYGADNFPDDVPAENGATHIGWFVRWTIERGLFLGDCISVEAIDTVRNGTVSAWDFMLEQLDGKLWPSDLSEEGQAFYEAHYDGYLNDVGRLLIENLESVYLIENSDANCQIVAAALDERWARFKAKTGDN